MKYSQLMCLLVCCGQAQEITPNVVVENSILPNGSRLTDMKFEGVPGVGYEIYRSYDLNSWFAESSTYGQGFQIEVPMMIQSAGSTQPVVVYEHPRTEVNIWIKPIIGAPGDYEISWVSLTGDSVQRVALSGLVSGGWANAPLGRHRFGIY